MANEIVKMVAKKANLSEPVAQIAVDTVIKFLKDKLPPVVGTTLDSFLGSGSTTSKSSKTTSKSKTTSSKSTKKSDSPLGGLGDIVSGALGGWLGKK
jgi:nucleoid DNA-binding protein